MYQVKPKDFYILSLPVDFGGCGWMRIRSPFKKINKYKLAKAEVMDEGQILEDDFRKVISKADVIIARPGNFKLMREVKKIFPYKKVIVDLDDDNFSILPTSQHYKEWGMEDVAYKIGEETVYLWKTGVNDFDKFRNRKNINDLEWMLYYADAITCVSQPLAMWISELMNKDVIHLPNYTDLDLYPVGEFIDPNKGDEFRIGYCGGASHAGDLQIIKNDMLKFLKNTPNARLYLIGGDFDTFDEAGEQVIKLSWMPFEANPFRMKTLALDVLLAPLEDNAFNRRKDPLKFWDASGLEVSLLASNVTPFKEVIKDKETGFLFDTAEDMRKILVRMVKGKEDLKGVARRARKHLEDTMSLDKHVGDIVELYKQIAKQPAVKI